jgi:predicted O-methyltransferase YrrM
MAWRVLRDGGVMVFDDYMWGDPRMPMHRPKIAIDAFMNIFAAEMIVLHIGYQVAIKKQRPV